jgi:Neuraminidase (sialidase)
MRLHNQFGPGTRSTTAVMLALALAMSSVMVVLAASLVQISSDPYTNTDSQHATQVEPDSFAFGSTIVTAVQTGRFFNGGASNINVATSTDGGATWVSTGLPGLTNNPPPGGGTFDRVSDPVVAYDARHGVWMVSTLPLIGRSSTVSPTAAGVYTSRSTDGGLTWGNPIFVTGSNLQSPDKN